MKRKTIVGLIAIVVIVSVVVFSGCIGERAPESTSPKIFPEISTKLGGTTIDIMKQVPNGSYTLCYINLKNVRYDDDLAEYYSYENDILVKVLADTGIPEVSISVDKMALGFGNAVLILGDFDLKKIRGYLEDEGWQQDTYREVEVWYRESGNVNEIALFKDEIIMGGKGGVKSIIKVINGEEKSLYDNKDVVDVVNKLPDGFRITTKGQLGDVKISPFNGIYYGAAARSFGSSEKKISREELKVHAIYKFDDERTAEDVAKKMEQLIQQYKGSETDVEITTQDEYMIQIFIYKISELSGAPPFMG